MLLIAASACSSTSNEVPPPSHISAENGDENRVARNAGVQPSATPTPTESSPSPSPSSSTPTTPAPVKPTTIIEKPKTNPTKTSDKTTGVPKGTKLKKHEGELIVSEAGKVIDGLEVRGSISVRAPNVTIKNTRVIGVKELRTGLIASRSTGLKVQNSEIYSTHRNPNTNGVMGSNFILDGVEIRDVVDQVHIHGAGNVTIKNSWLHSNIHYANDPNWGGGPSHDDNIQIVSGSNIVITNNRLSGSYNAAIMITQDDGKVSNVTIKKNRINHGGCSINLSPGSKGNMSNLKIHDNGFDSNQRVKYCAIIGPRAYASSLNGNYWIANGALASLSDGGS